MEEAIEPTLREAVAEIAEELGYKLLGEPFNVDQSRIDEHGPFKILDSYNALNLVKDAETETSWYPHSTHQHRGLLKHTIGDSGEHMWFTECVCGWYSPVEDTRDIAEVGHLLHIAFTSGRLDQ